MRIVFDAITSKPLAILDDEGSLALKVISREDEIIEVNPCMENPALTKGPTTEP